jgi:membrane-bound metal-dependent hydrolase YbcI (DUF457 family)
LYVFAHPVFFLLFFVIAIIPAMNVLNFRGMSRADVALFLALGYTCHCYHRFPAFQATISA